MATLRVELADAAMTVDRDDRGRLFDVRRTPEARADRPTASEAQAAQAAADDEQCRLQRATDA